MEIAVFLVSVLLPIPFIALEAIIKATMCIIYVPMCIILALFYPLVKNHIKWIEKWQKYAFTWKHGFYSGKIHKLWKYHN